MKYSQIKKAFTLIEILIVIAIIGILAVVVVMALAQSAKEKSRIAAGQQFADSLRAKAELEVFGSSSSEEGHWLKLNGDANDDWNSGAVTVNGANWVQGVNGEALEFDGSSTWISPESPNPGFFHNALTERTVEMFINANDTTSLQTLYDEGGSYNGFWMGINLDSLICIARNGDSGTLDTVSVAFSDTGKWHHVACTFDGPNQEISLHLDSQKVDTQSTNPSSNIGGHGSEPGIGASSSSDANGDNGAIYFNGLMDDVRISSMTFQ